MKSSWRGLRNSSINSPHQSSLHSRNNGSEKRPTMLVSERLAILETEMEILLETVKDFSTRLRKLEKFMWIAMGVLGTLQAIPLVLPLFKR